ncbi:MULTISPECIES: hypothetical protein [unclassified Streptomyces]|nr:MULTISPECIES: hypothetical protein [unclassified Streptomyces]
MEHAIDCRLSSRTKRGTTYPVVRLRMRNQRRRLYVQEVADDAAPFGHQRADDHRDEDRDRQMPNRAVHAPCESRRATAHGHADRYWHKHQGEDNA